MFAPTVGTAPLNVLSATAVYELRAEATSVRPIG
jgi:hypothetical protein